MKKLFIFLIISTFFFITVKPVEAHFLSTDKNIGAILHVDPNDDPVAGSQASFFFEFKDKQNKFKPQNCNCIFEINEGGKPIFSQSLFQNNSNPSLSNASVFYTFPKIDVYEIKVIGNPTSPNAFQPFTLIWYFRVDQEANQSESNNPIANFFSVHLIHIIPIAVLIIGFALYIFFSWRNKNSAGKGGEKKNVKKDSGDIY